MFQAGCECEKLSLSAQRAETKVKHVPTVFKYSHRQLC